MNWISHVYQISQKPVRRMIGLMSGTSLDGLDVAICDVRGHGSQTRVETFYFKTFQYQDQFKLQIQEIFAKQRVDSEKLTYLHRDISEIYSKYIHQALDEAHIPSSSVDLIASHGQTIFHFPVGQDSNKKSSTLQIGDGDHLAYKTGICTVSDFRQKHVAAGGQGAPLAIYADRILFAHSSINRVLLNLGGIANFTFLPCTQSRNEAFTYDTGPANTLIDQYCKKYLNTGYDEGGKIALSGEILPHLLQILEELPYFDMPIPKSTGQETFNLGWIEDCLRLTDIQINEVQHNDIITTLSALTVNTISKELLKIKTETGEFEILASGGGLHNHYITSEIERKIHQKVLSTASKGINPDAKEAIMMVVLANETICGSILNPELPRLKDFPEVSFGKISFP